MSDKKLLPCPFCGGEAYTDKVGKPLFAIWCKRCFCEIRKNTYEQVVEAWNTRVPMQKIVERLEEDSKHWWKMKQEALKFNEGDLVNRYDAFEIASNNAIDIVKEEGGLNEG